MSDLNSFSAPPLKKKSGSKSRVERIDHTLDQILKGGDFGAMLGRLSPEEQKLFWKQITQFRATGELNLDDLWKIDYHRQPPSMKQFIEDPYWMGAWCNPGEDGDGLYPAWREVLLRDFDLDSRIHNSVITGSLGIGKCLGVGTPVRMADGGVKTAENIVQGDQLMGDDGKPRNVLSTTSGEEQMYEIEALRPRHGLVWRCNGPHILVLKIYKGHWRAGSSAVTVEATAEEVFNNPDKYKKYRLVRLKGGYELPERQVPDDPYQFGLNLSRRGNAIPVEYAKNTRAIRLELLAGIIDTSGNKCANGCYQLSTSCFSLALQIQDLAWSLGCSCSNEKRHVNSLRSKGTTSFYRLVIGGAYDVPTRIPDKKSQIKASNRAGGNRRCPHVSGFKIRPTGVDRYYGFEIDGNRRFVLADGTITHNTVIATFILLYRIAITRCMRNPQSFLGLATGSAVFYILLSVTRSAVSETAWSDAKNLMSNSPFFKEECHFNPGKKYAGLHIPLGGGIFITAGSRGQNILGRNTMGVLLDEGNWRLEANPDTKAYELYNEVRTRISNRFQKMAGYLPALSMLASSAKDESSFTETAIEDIRRVDNPATEKVYRFAQFRIKRHAMRLSKRWFKVEHSLKNQEPRVLAGWYTEEGQPIKVEGYAHEAASDGAQIELVPEDFVDTFKRKVKIALQSICGVATGGSHRLFSSLEYIDKAISIGRQAGLVDPAKMAIIPVSEEDDQQIWDYLDHKTFLTRKSGRIIPLRDSEAPRYVHLDLATQNIAGLAICHAVSSKLVEGLYNRETGTTFSQYRRIVAYDFILALTSGQTKPISMRKIQDFIFWLRDYCGMRFGKVTSDSYGAGIPLQPLDARGIPTALLSLDKTKTPYYSWRTGLEESRVLLLPNPLLVREAEYLIDHPGGKIDHPDKTPYGPGSKDLTDAAAGAFYNCINDESKSAGNVSASDVMLHTSQQTAEAPPMVTVAPVEARPARRYDV